MVYMQKDIRFRYEERLEIGQNYKFFKAVLHGLEHQGREQTSIYDWPIDASRLSAAVCSAVRQYRKAYNLNHSQFKGGPLLSPLTTLEFGDRRKDMKYHHVLMFVSLKN